MNNSHFETHWVIVAVTDTSNHASEQCFFFQCNKYVFISNTRQVNNYILRFCATKWMASFSVWLAHLPWRFVFITQALFSSNAMKRFSAAETDWSGALCCSGLFIPPSLSVLSFFPGFSSVFILSSIDIRVMKLCKTGSPVQKRCLLPDNSKLRLAMATRQ